MIDEVIVEGTKDLAASLYLLWGEAVVRWKEG